jgi:hypothetical protein
LAAIDKSPSAPISKTALIAIGKWMNFNIGMVGKEDLRTGFSGTNVPIRLTAQLRCCKLRVTNLHRLSRLRNRCANTSI